MIRRKKCGHDYTKVAISRKYDAISRKYDCGPTLEMQILVALEKTFFQDFGNQLASIFHIQFGEDVIDMRFDRGKRDFLLHSNSRIRRAIDNELNDALLNRCQFEIAKRTLSHRELLNEFRGNIRIKRHSTGQRALAGSQHFIDVERLQQVPAHARGGGANDVLHAPVDRQHDNFCGRVRFFETAESHRLRSCRAY